jgi:hypothetical protein
LFEFALDTYNLLLVGQYVTVWGQIPTPIVATTVFVAGFMTETLLEPWLETYNLSLLGQ